jgi:2-phosphoglycolate phosphatase
MNLCKLKTVFFDLDGTLLDTAPDLAYALNQLLTQEGLQTLPFEKIRPVASSGSPGLVGLAFQIDENHHDYIKLRNAFINFYYQHLSVNTRLFPGMDLVLERLEQLGIRWGVVTNKSSGLAKQLLTDLDLAGRCACIVGGDCTSKQKPNPQPLLYACQLTGSAPKECVYIGDAEHDIEAAQYAGMQSIAALYGYLPEDTAPEYWNADYYIDHPKDILCWINKQLAYQIP